MGKIITSRAGDNKNIYLLIDADGMIFSSCLRKKKDKDDDGFVRIEEDAEHKFEELLFNMMNHIEENFNFNIVSYIVFFEGKGNFRYNVDPMYKSRRKGIPRPPTIPAVKALIKRSQPHFESINAETDDTVVSTYLKYKDKYPLVIASPDKDLKTIPCIYYNTHPKHKTLQIIDEDEAMYNKYAQFIEGDYADSIHGIKGKGEKAALKILKGCKTDFQYIRRLYPLYQEEYKGKANIIFRRNAMLLNIGLSNICTPNLDEFV